MKKIRIDNTEDTIEAIAFNNGLTPAELYRLMGKSEAGSGGGWGRKTLGQVCQQAQLDEQKVIAKLAQRNISAASGDVIKDLAGQAQMRLGDLVQWLSDGAIQPEH